MSLVRDTSLRGEGLRLTHRCGLALQDWQFLSVCLHQGRLFPISPISLVASWTGGKRWPMAAYQSNCHPAGMPPFWTVSSTVRWSIHGSCPVESVRCHGIWVRPPMLPTSWVTFPTQLRTQNSTPTQGITQLSWVLSWVGVELSMKTALHLWCDRVELLRFYYEISMSCALTKFTWSTHGLGYYAFDRVYSVPTQARLKTKILCRYDG